MRNDPKNPWKLPELSTKNKIKRYAAQNTLLSIYLGFSHSFLPTGPLYCRWTLPFQRNVKLNSFLFQERNYVVKMLNCTGIARAPFINMSSTFYSTNSTCDFDMYFNKTLNNLVVEIETIVLPRNTRLTPNWNFEFCDRLKRDKNSLVQKVYKKVSSFGRMPTDCPIPPGRYYMHQLSLDDLLHTTYLPLMDARIIVRFFSTVDGKRRAPLGDMGWDFRLQPKVDSKGVPLDIKNRHKF